MTVQLEPTLDPRNKIKSQFKPTNLAPSFYTCLLCRTLRILSNTLRCPSQILRILLRYLFRTFSFNAFLVHVYPAHLRHTNAHKEEVNSSQTAIVLAKSPEETSVEQGEAVTASFGV